jgi:tetratricopeptide (TPR) repeat protein
MGVTLFELLTFQRPFRAPTHAALFEAIRMQATPDARRINPAIDAGLHAVLSVALAKDPKSRYPTANAFAKDLERWASGQRVLARKPTSWDRLKYWARVHPSAAVLACVLAIGLPSLASLGTHYFMTRESVRAGELALRNEAVDLILTKGFLNYGDSDPKRLLDAGVEAEALDPNDAMARIAQVLGLRRQGRLDDALTLVLKGHPLSTMTRAYFRRSLLRELGRLDEASEASLDPPPPETPEDLYTLAASELDQGGREANRRALRGFIETMLRSDRPRAVHAIARLEAAAALNDAFEVEGAVEAIRSRIPASLGTEIAIGLAFAELGDSIKAASAFESALREAPNDPYVLAHLSQTYLQLGREDDARQTALASTKADPSKAYPYTACARIEVKLDRPEKALVWLDRALEKDPSAAYVHELRFHALRLMNQLEEALAAISKAQQLSSKDGKYAYLKGALLAMMGQMPDSRTIFEALVVSHPEQASAFDGLSRCLYFDDDYEGAKSAMARAIELAPDDMEYRYSLCTMYLEDGEVIEAMPHLTMMRSKNVPAGEQGAVFIRALLQAGAKKEADGWLAALRQEGASDEDLTRLQKIGTDHDLMVAKAQHLLRAQKGAPGLLEELSGLISYFGKNVSYRHLLDSLKARRAVETGNPEDLPSPVEHFRF